MRRLLLASLQCLSLLVVFTPAPAAAADGGKGAVVLYTALTATTPQIPLWAAIGEGWPEGGSVLPEYWKTLDDLRGVMLAGKGDIWVGHLEGFAQAALRGAPVRLVAITGWKKFYFVTPGASRAVDLARLAEELRLAGQPLAIAPQDSPALGILESMKRRGGPAFSVAAMQPQQLMLEMVRGTRGYALLPEPFVSSLLARKPEYRVAASLEEEYARLYGGPARMPLAGIAVNAGFADKNPLAVKKLAESMQRHAQALSGDAESAMNALPENIRKSVGEAVIRVSLSRDTILSVPAWEAKEEIAAFLRMVLPKTDPAKLEALLDGPFVFGQ